MCVYERGQSKTLILVAKIPQLRGGGGAGVPQILGAHRCPQSSHPLEKSQLRHRFRFVRGTLRSRYFTHSSLVLIRVYFYRLALLSRFLSFTIYGYYHSRNVDFRFIPYKIFTIKKIIHIFKLSNAEKFVQQGGGGGGSFLAHFSYQLRSQYTFGKSIIGIVGCEICKLLFDNIFLQAKKSDPILPALYPNTHELLRGEVCSVLPRVIRLYDIKIIY